MPYELRPDGGGCEDPRVTYVEPLGRYVMTYTAFSPVRAAHRAGVLLRPAALGTTRSRDLRTLRRHPLRRRRQQGRRHVPARRAQPLGSTMELAILHRPLFPGTLPEDTMMMDEDRDVDLHRESIWISYTPGVPNDVPYPLRALHVPSPFGGAGLGLGVTQDRQWGAAGDDQARMAVHLSRRLATSRRRERHAPDHVLGRRDGPLEGPSPGTPLSLDPPGALAPALHGTARHALQRRLPDRRSTGATTSASPTASTSTTGSTTFASPSPASTYPRPCRTPARPTRRRAQTR